MCGPHNPLYYGIFWPLCFCLPVFSSCRDSVLKENDRNVPCHLGCSHMLQVEVFHLLMGMWLVIWWSPISAVAQMLRYGLSQCMKIEQYKTISTDLALFMLQFPFSFSVHLIDHDWWTETVSNLTIVSWLL